MTGGKLLRVASERLPICAARGGGVSSRSVLPKAEVMKERLLRMFKTGLTHVGARFSDPVLHRFQIVVNYMKLGRWMASHGYSVPKRASDRTAVFDAVAQRVRAKKVLYLEFGVFQGASMRYWSKALAHPGAKLHGFDSFEGLPEDFDVRGPYVKGTFSTGGVTPQIDDTRVEFFKGWFQESLPKYVVPAHDVLVICLDADLYSSTIFVLRYLEDWIRPGTFIYFDDMSRPDHEPRALDEFIAETGKAFRAVAADYSLNTVFLECTR